MALLWLRVADSETTIITPAHADALAEDEELVTVGGCESSACDFASGAAAAASCTYTPSSYTGVSSLSRSAASFQPTPFPKFPSAQSEAFEARENTPLSKQVNCTGASVSALPAGSAWEANGKLAVEPHAKSQRSAEAAEILGDAWDEEDLECLDF